MLKPTKYPVAKIKGLDEALEMTEDQKKAVRQELSGILTAEDIIDMHGAALEMLKETDAHLDEFVAAYERNKQDREPVERIYGLKMSILESMARRFNPLSQYGRKLLAESVKCREEFEALIGPMITRITAGNIDLFKTVIPLSVKEDILSGRREALGALRTNKKTLYGVGAIVFHTEDSVFEENGSLKIDWLFVNNRFRGRAVSHFLIAELLNSAIKRGIEDITVEYPTDLSEKKLLGYVFGTWNFELQTTISPDAIIRIGDITSFKEIKQFNKGPKAVSSVKGISGSRFIKEILKRRGIRDYLVGNALPEDYFDTDLSFYMGSETDVSAMLLTHRTVTGLVRVEYLYTKPGKEEESFNLIAAFLEKAVMTCQDEDFLYIPVESEEIGDFLEKICSKQMAQYLLYGTLNKPLPDLDISTEEIEEYFRAQA